MLVSIALTALSVAFVLWLGQAYEEAKAAGIVFRGYIGEEKAPDAVTSDAKKIGR